MDVKLKDIVETIVSKQDFYYRVISDDVKINDRIKQPKEKRQFDVLSTHKRMMEKLLEKWKPNEYPSRYACNFVFDNLEDTKKFQQIMRHTGTIYKVRIFPKGNIAKVDSEHIGRIIECLEKSEYEERDEESKNLWKARAVKMIKNYWAGKPNELTTPLWEILFNGDIQIIERIEDVK